MSKSQIKLEKRDRRRKKIRAKVSGTAERPRLSIFRSNTSLYLQLINDDKGITLAAVNTRKAMGKNIMEKAKEIGKEIAVKAKALKIEKVVFDRGGYIFTGKVKAAAEGAREGGLLF
jgi:large subunit ribosomal protein L18